MTRTYLLVATLATALPLTAAAQEVRVYAGRAGDGGQWTMLSSDRPMLGVTTASASSRADTLGLLIEDVRRDSPAAKAGLKEGDRLQAINGVSLRADRGDAGEDYYSGVLMRRLQREMAKVKTGDTVSLRVYGDGRSRDVRVAPVSSEMLYGAAGGMSVLSARSDRAVIGVMTASSGTARDTLGVFVQSVTPEGPAEKAGIIEGDRIAAINGVSLRVAREDVEDPMIGSAKAQRLRTELGKLTAGAVAELTVVSAGRTRNVRVTTVKSSDLPGGNFEFRAIAPALEGAMQRMRVRSPDGVSYMVPTPPTPPTPRAAPVAPVPPRAVPLLRRGVITI